MKNKKKYFFFLILFLLIVFLTFYSIFSETSLNSIFNDIKKVNIIYIFICILFIILYFVLQGIFIKIVLKSLNKKITLKKGIFYSLVEFYFSGITPSSTGGQPVQMYFMTKDKIPVRKSFITLILNTIYFKLIILVLGILVLIFNNDYLFNNSSIYFIVFLIGFLVDSLIVIFGLLSIFKQKFIKKIAKTLFNICSKIKFLKKYFSDEDKLKEFLSRYRSEALYIKKNKKTVFLGFIITFFQRMLLFSIPYIIYISLGFSKYNYFDLFSIQIIIQIAIDILPLPGGSGFSEKMMNDMYYLIYGVALAPTSMLLTRTFTFYIPLIISGIFIAGNSIKNKINKKRLNSFS